MEIKLQKKLQKQLIPFISVVVALGSLGFSVVSTFATPAARTVLVANRNVAEGEQLKPSDFSTVKMAIGASLKSYISKLETGYQAARSITSGELLAKRLVAMVSEKRIPIRLNNLNPLPSAITVGDRIDIWSQPKSNSAVEAPEPVVFGAIVTSIEPNNSMGQNFTNLEVRIGSDFLESLLAVNDGNHLLSVILNETLSDTQ